MTCLIILHKQLIYIRGAWLPFWYPQSATINFGHVRLNEFITSIGPLKLIWQHNPLLVQTVSLESSMPYIYSEFRRQHHNTSWRCTYCVLSCLDEVLCWNYSQTKMKFHEENVKYLGWLANDASVRTITEEGGKNSDYEEMVFILIKINIDDAFFKMHLYHTPSVLDYRPFWLF
jgi:hypothetical protein